MKAGGDHGGDGEVRVDVPAGDAVLDAQGAAVPDDAQGAGSVVFAPRDGGRGEGALGVALVRVYVRGEEQHELAQAADLSGERSEEHTSELQSRQYLVCRLLLEKKKNLQHVI